MQASTEILTKVDVLPVHGGRRRRPDVVQGRTIAETLEAASTVTGVARRYGLNANQLSAWRRPARDGRLVATAAACRRPDRGTPRRARRFLTRHRRR